MFFKKLFLNKIKQYIKTIPAAILSSMVFILLFCTLIFLAIKSLPQDEPLIKAKVGVISSDINESLLDMGLNLLSSYKSTSMSFDFVQMKSKDAYDALRKNEIVAIFDLPNNVIDGILYRQKNPVNIIFNQSNPLSESILTELTQSGASMLASAQSSTYTTHYFYSKFNLDNIIDEAYYDIDSIGYRYVLNRENVFKYQDISQNHQNFFSFYFCGILSVILFLTGITVSSQTFKDSDAFMLYARREKNFEVKYVIAKIIALTIYYIFLELLIALIYSIFAKISASIPNFIEIPFNKFQIKELFVFIIIALFISSFMHLIFFLSNKSHEGIIAIFIITIIFSFLEGIIIPSDFFPQKITFINLFLPFHYVANGFNIAFFDSSLSLLPLFIYTITNIIVCIFILKIRVNKRLS